MTFEWMEWALLLVAGGFAAGVVAASWRARRVKRARRRVPKHWPLDSRRIVNSHEKRVWRWLDRTFPDQHVMIKMPVTRFSFPRHGENSAYLYQLLGGVYCTFTVCADDGRVVGCVDVPGLQGISRTNRQIKLSLLTQCGIAYRVLRATELPSPAEIRIEFLGDDAFAAEERAHERSAVMAAQQKLREVVERRRHRAPGRGREDGPRESAEDPDFASSGLDSGFGGSAWQQPNSFVAPLDSRPAGLH